MESELKVGDIVRLLIGSVVLVYRKDLLTLDRDSDCVVEGVRSFDAGSEDDHFLPGVVADLRPLSADGAYDETQPLLTVALSGDFEPRFIQTDLVATGRMKKTFVRE